MNGRILTDDDGNVVLASFVHEFSTGEAKSAAKMSSGWTLPVDATSPGLTPIDAPLGPITAGGYLEAEIVLDVCDDQIGGGIALSGGDDLATAVVLWFGNDRRVGIYGASGAGTAPDPPESGSRPSDQQLAIWLRLSWVSANVWRGEKRDHPGDPWTAVGDDLSYTMSPTQIHPAVGLRWPQLGRPARVLTCSPGSGQL